MAMTLFISGCGSNSRVATTAKVDNKLQVVNISESFGSYFVFSKIENNKIIILDTNPTYTNLEYTYYIEEGIIINVKQKLKFKVISFNEKENWIKIEYLN